MSSKVSVSCTADGRVVDELQYPKCKFNKEGVCITNNIEIEVHSQPNAVTYFNCFTFVQESFATKTLDHWSTIHEKDEEE